MIAEQKRVLVLGATGFLGTHAVQSFLTRGHIVTALVRGKPHDSEFVHRRLFEQVRIVGGMAEDTMGLRHIISLHEIDAIVQCAGTDTANGTHALTASVMTAVAHSSTKPMVIVPLRASDTTSQPRFQVPPSSKLNVAFVRLPELFGPGELRPDRWITRLFHQAAQGYALPWPDSNQNWLDVTTAADHLANTLYTAGVNSLGHWIDTAAAFTTPELMAQVKAGSTPVAETLTWYRANADRIAARIAAGMLSLRAAA
ncbi:hypothetical protein BH11PLA2_BH11PLA2_24670 [soil metagenome]